jgi:hypothetical protein
MLSIVLHLTFENKKNERAETKEYGRVKNEHLTSKAMTVMQSSYLKWGWSRVVERYVNF